ncbi:MAG: 2-C-methyl-D-erythritol 4-phosphate cytidylyltransferase [Acidobacteria bacterium]|nr:2-C-methyl-D-erythritol 4-phosphate cytidylyltransferase [Acidobacteriota bacterium]
MANAASILAGGTGQRMQSDLPKQFMDLRGEPLISRTLRPFMNSGAFSTLAVAIHPDWHEHLAELLDRHWPGQSIHLVPGGLTRQASSHHVLEHFARLPNPPRGVLIHDAARCLLSPQLLHRCVRALMQTRAFTCAIETTDTIAILAEGRLAQVPSRETLRRIQTPQGFDFRTILSAHRQALERGLTNVSDDAQLLLHLGVTVQVIPGDSMNLKISHPGDFALAEFLLNHQSPAGGP